METFELVRWMGERLGSRKQTCCWCFEKTAPPPPTKTCREFLFFFIVVCVCVFFFLVALIAAVDCRTNRSIRKRRIERRLAVYNGSAMWLLVGRSSVGLYREAAERGTHSWPPGVCGQNRLNLDSLFLIQAHRCGYVRVVGGGGGGRESYMVQNSATSAQIAAPFLAHSGRTICVAAGTAF